MKYYVYLLVSFKNKKLISSSLKWTKLYGTSFSSSRLVSGNFDKINYLEDSISKNVNCEKTLILGSGFLLNSTLIPALTDNNVGQRNEILIFSDRYIRWRSLGESNPSFMDENHVS